MAAQTRWSKEDPVEGTRAAREAFLQGFIDQVDPERRLSQEERLRRAESARKAHFTWMSLESSKARAIETRRKDARHGGETT